MEINDHSASFVPFQRVCNGHFRENAVEVGGNDPKSGCDFG